MIPKSELKQIVMLGYLTGPMLEKLVPITDQLMFEENEFVFREGGRADRFYMVREGKVLLEQRISEKITVSVGAIKPGFSFGWSSMLDEKRYTTDAVCAEPTRLFSFRAEKIKSLLDADHHMGYIFCQRLLRIIKKRYNARTEQFIKVLTNHPDLKDLF